MKNIFFLILLLLSFAFGLSISDISANESIKKALDTRDNFFAAHLSDFQKNSIPDPADILLTLDKSSDKKSPWYFLLSAKTAETDRRDYYYKKSIKSCRSDIGKLWVLFLEFHKAGLRKYENEILDSLESLELQHGVEVLPEIAQQLQLLAVSEYLKKEYHDAVFYLDNSSRFSRTKLPIELSLLSFQSSGKDLFSVQNIFVEEFKTTWRPQVVLLKFLNSALVAFFKVVGALVLTILLLKYFPKAIHSLSCNYPKSVPYQMRFFFTTLLLLVSLVFGVFPLIVLLIILILRVQMTNSGKAGVRFLLVLLVTYPLTMNITARLTYSLSENSPISLYEQALLGQPTAELYSKIKSAAETDDITPEVKALHLTSMSLIQFKRNNIDAAITLVRKAYSLWSDNEQVLIAAGNIYHKYGNLKQAFTLFKKAVEKFPESPQINYNYGQINLEMVGITNGTDYINKGAEKAPNIVNGFITRNSQFFGEAEWPPTRRFFIGTLSPKLFWHNLKEFSRPPDNTHNLFWGSNFLGFPIYISIGVMAAALILSSLIVPTYMQVKKSGDCVLCGKPICKVCRINDICNECHSMLHNIKNESLTSSLKVKLSKNRRVVILLKAHLCDLLFPGTRDIFLKKKSKLRITGLIPTTLFVYTMYSLIPQIEFNLIPLITLKYKFIILSPGVIYSLYFIITNVRSLIVNIRKGGK